MFLQKYLIWQNIKKTREKKKNTISENRDLLAQ